MKQDIAEYVSLCDTCQRVKANWIVATIEYPRMEMGGDRNGFHSWIAPYSSRV
jgi:hypothetical protein